MRLLKPVFLLLLALAYAGCAAPIASAVKADTTGTQLATKYPPPFITPHDWGDSITLPAPTPILPSFDSPSPQIIERLVPAPLQGVEEAVRKAAQEAARGAAQEVFKSTQAQQAHALQAMGEQTRHLLSGIRSLSPEDLEAIRAVLEAYQAQQQAQGESVFSPTWGGVSAGLAALLTFILGHFTGRRKARKPKE